MKKFQSLGESKFKQFTKAQMRSIIGGKAIVDRTSTFVPARDGGPSMDDMD